MYQWAQREGLRQLHLHDFKLMLPIFFRVNHISYARFGIICLSENNKLPNPVKSEFERGNFVVKRSDQKFQPGRSRSESGMAEWLLQERRWHNRQHRDDVSLKELGCLFQFEISFVRQSWSLGWGEMMHSLIMKAIRLKVDLKDEDNLNTFQSFKLFSADATKDRRWLAYGLSERTWSIDAVSRIKAFCWHQRTSLWRFLLSTKWIRSSPWRVSRK